MAKLAWVAGVLAITALGTANMAVSLVPNTKLAGFEILVPVPKLSGRAVWQEKFQHDAVAWFDQSWGLRGPFVRTDNTINVGLFHEVRSDRTVVLGSDGVIFNYEDSNFVNRSDTADESIEAGKTIARVQRKARAHGHALIPIIIPSKTSIYRAAYPKAHRRRGAFELSDRNVYGALVTSLRENGARFVDGRATLLAEAKTPDDAFTKTARHWRWPAACRVMQLAVDLARPDIPELGSEQIDCHYRRQPAPPLDGWDLDLFNLLNVWGKPPDDVEGRELDGKKGGLQIPTLFVGTSFVTMLTDISRKQDVLQPSLFYYYDVRVSDTKTPLIARDLEPNTETWRTDTFSKRIFIVGILETFSPGDGLKFIGEIEKELDTMNEPAR